MSCIWTNQWNTFWFGHVTLSITEKVQGYADRRHLGLVDLLTLASTERAIDAKVDAGHVRVGSSIVDGLQCPFAQPDVGTHLRRHKSSK